MDYDGMMYRHPECADGCRLDQARQLHREAQGMLNQAQKLAGRTTEGKIMSQALWCDQGDHPFSARDPKAEHWERNGTGKDGSKVMIPWDVCGKHMEAINGRLAAMEAEMGALPRPADG
jgi:hypothetical protein